VPWKALKNTPKKTRTMTSSTLLSMPRPKARMNTEPSTMRGIALSTLMNGPKTSARNRTRPSATPATIPSTVPMAKPMSASRRVVVIWSPSDPTAVPWVVQVRSWAMMPERHAVEDDPLRVALD